MPLYQKPLRTIVEKLNAGYYPNMHYRISSIRNWVNANSVHLIDDEHDSYAFHVPTVIKKLHDFNVGVCSRPHLSCGPRAYAMKEILDAMLIESRIVDLFVIRDDGSPNSHTLIEVFNGESQHWELHDPDFNVCYSALNQLKVVAVDEALNLWPSIGYCTNGFLVENPINLAGTLRLFFSLGVLYRYSYQGEKSCFLTMRKLDELKRLKITHDKADSFFEYVCQKDFHPAFQQRSAAAGVA